MYRKLKFTTCFSLVIMITIIIIALSLVVFPKIESLYYISFFKSLKLPICSVLLVINFAVLFITKQFSKITFSAIDFLILLFTTFIFASALYARNSEFAVNVGCIWIVYYGIFKLFQSNIESEWIKKTIIIVLTLGLIFSLILFTTVALSSADYSKGFFNILNGDHLKTMHHQFGLHRNNVSSLLVLAAGIPYFFVVKSKNKWQLGLSFAILSLLFLDLLITRSRGSLLAFLLISVLVLITFWFKKIVNRKVIVACFATLFFTAFVNIKLQSNATEYIDMLNPLYGVISADGDDRLAMWKISYQLFKEKPLLGFGAGSWEFEYQKYGAGDLKTHHHNRSSHTHSHSYYVNVFFTVGIIGGLFFLLIIFLFPLQKLLGKLKNDDFELEDIIWFVGIIAFLIVSLFYGTTYNSKNILQGQSILFFFF